jgi:hypothetical protein
MPFYIHSIWLAGALVTASLPVYLRIGCEWGEGGSHGGSAGDGHRPVD